MGDLPSDDPKGAVAAINDCWNKVGIHGDGSCPELEQHAHCRNCPTYSAGALTLLDRNLPAEYLSSWTAHFAREKQVEERDSQSALIFRIGSEWFALPTLVLDEVAELRTIHSVPHRGSGSVLGLVNVRGELLICVSLARMLGMEEPSSPESTSDGHRRLVVIRHDGGRMAFPVDDAQTIHRYHPRELKGAPATIVKAATAYTKALLSWKGKTIGCLDGELIVQTLNRSVA
jgi:chemotaxis-related protein WspD